MDVDRLISELTLEEKISLLMGKNVWWTKDVKRLNIPSIMMADGPHGIRKQRNELDNLGLNKAHLATCFPTAATVACSFDRDLVYQMGRAIAEEARSRGVSIVLGPGINIKRNPLCGRNFEYYSEDPYLTGELAYSFIKGVEDQEIGTSIKHFAFNNQEHLRMSISSIIDDRTKHEIYLRGFQRALQANPATLMTSYNKVDEHYVGESKDLLTDLIRNQWGYQGVMISDWGAVSNRVASLKAGLDIEMPYSGEYHKKKIIESVHNGEIDEELINQSVKRILTMIKRYPTPVVKTHLFHHELSCDIARQSAVLLQNKDGLLPLSNNQNVLVVGEFATKPRYQGGGSSHISTNQVISFLDVLDNNSINYEYAAGYDLHKPDDLNIDLIEDAKVKAINKDAIILFIGLPDAYESEGFDRKHLNIPKSHSSLIGELFLVNPNIVVVLECGSPIIMPWKNHVKSILHMYLSGEATNQACYDLLYGIVSPSGKLAESYPLDLEDVASYHHFPGGNHSVHYKESIYVGYRHYTTFGVDVLFPFGHGLSYTTFAYDDLTLSKSVITECESVDVTCSITNTGNMKAKETVFLWIKNAPSIVFKASKELKEFAKVELEPGETKKVTFTIHPEQFAFYNTVIRDWYIETGIYQIEIGSSIDDIRLSSSIHVNQSVKAVLPDYQSIAPIYYTDDFVNISDHQFEEFIGRKLPKLSIEPKRPFSIDATLHDIKHTKFGKILYNIVKKEMSKSIKTDEAWMAMLIEKIAEEQPLRSLVSMGGGVITKEEMLAMLEMINGHWLKGLRQYMKASNNKKNNYKKEH